MTRSTRNAPPSPPPVDAGELFDAYADRYADTVNASVSASGEDVDYFAQRKAAEVVRWYAGAGLPLPERLLDFGCGTGLSTRMLAAALAPRCALTGLDVSADSIRVAREQASDPRQAFVHGVGDRLPFDDASFDAAFTACVFHHIERDEHQAWLRELRRVIRPGGVLFLFEHNPRNPLTVRAVRACPFDEGVVLLDPRYAGRALADAGFAAGVPTYYFFFPSVLRALRGLEPALGRVPLGAQYYFAARRGLDA